MILHPGFMSSFCIAVAALSCLLYLALMIFTLTRRPLKPIHITYSLFTLSLAWWMGFYTLWLLSSTEANAKVLLHTLMAGVTIAPAIFYHFTVTFTGAAAQFKWKTLFAYAISLFFLWANFFTAWFVSSWTQEMAFQWWPRAGHAYSAYIVFGMWVFISALLHMIDEMGHSDGRRKMQLLYLTVGSVIGMIGALFNVPLWYGIPVPPVGNIALAFNVALVAYAIFKWELFDIRIALAKGTTYSFLILGITLVYFAIVFLAELTLRTLLGYSSSLATLIGVCSVALLFHPVEKRAQNISSRIIWGKSAEELAEENDRLHAEVVRSERLRAVGTLAAGMAHEIKNPLTVIQTFTDFLPEKGADPDFRERFHNIVNTELSRISQTVSQLLQFGRPEPPRLAALDPAPLLSDTLELLAGDFLKCRVKVQTDFPQSPCMVEADEQQLKQVFVNLCLNAMQAMHGEGTLCVRVTPTGPQVRIDFLDTGSGIAPQDLQRIWDPFFTTKEHGSGLGLGIVHRIIEEHGGRVEIRSELGKGTVVGVVLPVNLDSGSQDQ